MVAKPTLNNMAAILARTEGQEKSVQRRCNLVETHFSKTRRIMMRMPGQVMAMLSLAIGALLTPALAQDDTRARKMMEEAFNRRYRWNESLKGFLADFTLTREGKTVKGSIKADVSKPHGGVEVTCDDEQVKKLVQDTVASTVTHTRAASFDQAFGSCGFSVAGDGTHGGTKIALSGHGFFKDFTVKDGNIIENHGTRGEMSSEVKVRQVIWIADSGKTLPREYAFKIRTGNGEQKGQTTETWREIDGVWLPTWYQMIRNDGSAPVGSTLKLENIKVEQGTH